MPDAGTGAVKLRRRLHVDGRQRAYHLHAPLSGRRSSSLPLIVMLHGHGGTAARFRRLTGMDAAADAKGVLVAYPEGTSWSNVPWRSWNAGHCCGYGKARQVDDVAFFDALLEDIQRAFPVDAQRIYVAGVSNGGMLAYRLACERSERIAGIAVVAGAMSDLACQPTEPVSVLIIHGTADRLVPYDGTRSPVTRDARSDRAVRDAASYWVAHNACGSEPEHLTGGAVRLEQYAGCRDGTSVTLYTIEGGRHAWPGARGRDDLSATETIVGFFTPD